MSENTNNLDENSSHEPAETYNERKFREKPFCYQDKDILRLIRKKNSNKPRQNEILRQIYFTLTEIASDRGNNRFSASMKEIASYSGFSPWTIRRHLPILVEYGAILIRQVIVDKEQSANEYTLLSLKTPGANVSENEDGTIRKFDPPSLPARGGTSRERVLLEDNNIEILSLIHI